MLDQECLPLMVEAEFSRPIERGLGSWLAELITLAETPDRF